MKKILAVLAILVSAACTQYEDCADNKPVVSAEPKAEPVLAQPNMPVPVVQYTQVSTLTVQPACPCAAAKTCTCSLPDPNREVQRPRIKVTEVEAQQPRRKCPMDNQMINCGCGNHKTFEQPVTSQQFNGDVNTVAPALVSAPANVLADNVAVREVVPAMPEAYVLASNRVVSRFLNDSSSIYVKNPRIRLYVKPAQTLSNDLPKGATAGSDNFKRQIASSYTFEIVDEPSNADYYMETTADWFDTPSKSVPAISYKSVLYDSKNNKVKEWIEIIKKADNSQSWL